jgi:hypothetical protein
MTLSRNCRLIVLSCFSLFVATPWASAQTVSDQWPGLSSSALQTVYVLDHAGAETSGKLLRLDPDAVVLLIDGSEQRFNMADVTRIQKRDSLKNGTLIGAAIGVLMGLVAAGISDCPGDDPGGSCGGFRAATALISVGMYAGLGAGIDALVRGRTTIYAEPGQPATRTLAARSSRRVALQAGFSW